jgi:altronate dehydratase
MSFGTSNLRIDLYIHQDTSTTDAKLDLILTSLTAVVKQENIMSNELDALTTQVAANTSVEESAVTLLNGLSAQITALKNDPVALQALATSLKTSGNDLANAITANTPAAA